MQIRDSVPAGARRHAGAGRRLTALVVLATLAPVAWAAAPQPAHDDQRTANDILENVPDFAPISAARLRAITPPAAPSSNAAVAGVTFGGGAEPFGESTMAKWRAAMDEAAITDCLHSEGLKRQPTGFGPLALTGFNALPLILVAKLRGKCK